jgi:broad specificity phosphatase PhoE
MTRVYLLRHGATAANRHVPYRLQGRGSDLPLDDVGRQQAEAAASALAHIAFVAVYSSPLLRAVQTAEIVAARRGLSVHTDPGLIEGDVGRWEGLTWDEAAARDPEAHRRFFADSGTTPYPDGESFLDVQLRATPAIAGIAERHDGDSIAIVGHNILNRAYLAGVIGLEIGKAREIRQSNGGVNVLEIDGSRAVALTLNAALHLEGLG